VQAAWRWPALPMFGLGSHLPPPLVLLFNQWEKNISTVRQHAAWGNVQTLLFFYIFCTLPPLLSQAGSRTGPSALLLQPGTGSSQQHDGGTGGQVTELLLPLPAADKDLVPPGGKSCAVGIPRMWLHRYF